MNHQGYGAKSMQHVGNSWIYFHGQIMETWFDHFTCLRVVEKGWNRIIFWLVVWNIFILPFFWEYSSQLTNIFQRGSNHQPVFFSVKDGDRINEDFPNENCVKLQNWAPYCPGPTEADIFGWKTLKRNRLTRMAASSRAEGSVKPAWTGEVYGR